EGGKVQGLGLIVPGHPEDSVTVHFGYGRTRAGRVGTGHGFNAYSIWRSGTGGFGTRAVLAKTGMRARPATTQQHHAIEQESEAGKWTGFAWTPITKARRRTRAFTISRSFACTAKTRRVKLFAPWERPCTARRA